MNNQKESFYIKFIKYLYHINGDIDEYKISEINRIGNNAFMILIVYFWLEIMALMVPLFLSLNLQNTLLIVFFSNALMLFIIMSYIYFSIYRLKLDQIDAYDEKDYLLKLKKAKRKSILGAFIFFVLERLLTLFIDFSNNTDHLSLIQLIISPKRNINWIIGALSVGVISYFRLKSKIKK
ncbi:DUF3278 domain-containing protein [Apilactobacillus apisilvae]|uniref:DUF3278 domain-containing protein n=1 Tax=Apilactobacillus apisilvae TaxID=2923364 RepID=A0ABY4PFZ2_9LACO|nr:DUF3278 domain-containing protein [Apilactobacillus apisilvae]UQS84709.1 DUF3278 domain-containing protein [Apilactobacillus apisilvae]